MERFANRREAGRTLARELSARALEPNGIVLALPRGGVPVGFEIAKTLGLPLDVFVVRKLGVPKYEELAMGAIASGGARVLNDDVVRKLGISERDINLVAAREEGELRRREREYRGDLPPLDVRDKSVILVDDGLATGATMRAAVRALRQRRADKITVAVPVGSIDAVKVLSREADAVVCLLQPRDFEAVGAWYDDFSQTSDEEVRELMTESLQVEI